MEGEADCLYVLRRQSICGRVLHGDEYFVPPTMEDRPSNDTYQKRVLSHRPVSQSSFDFSHLFSTDAMPMNLTSEMRQMTSFVTVSNKVLFMFDGDFTSLFSN